MYERYGEGVLEAGARDFLTPAFLLATLLPLLVAAAILAGVAVHYAPDVAAWAESGMAAGMDRMQAAVGDWLSVHRLFEIVVSSAAVNALSSFLFGGLLLSVVFLLAITLQLLVLGMLTPWIAKTIGRRHYPAIERKEFGNPLSAMLYLVAVFLLICVGLLLTSPLLLVPVLGLVVFHLLLFTLFKKFLVRDVARSILSWPEYRRIRAANRMALLGLCALLYLFACIPFLGLFLQTFFASVLSHFFFREAGELRATDAFLGRTVQGGER